MTQSILLEVLREQKNEKEKFDVKNFCERPEEAKINLQSKKAQVVIGVRRSGKSTLCFNALKKSGVNFAYVNFDDERLSKMTVDDLNEMLRCLIQIYGDFTCLFMDEAQNVDGWHLFVNRILRQGMRVVITGSNAKLMSSELSTHLTGRYNEIEVFPFSFKEFCEMRKVEVSCETTRQDALLRKAFDEYLHVGGFPEIVNGEEPAEEYVDLLVDNILNRDILQRFKVRYRDTFQKIANHLMNNAPCEVVYKSLQELFGLRNDHTVENYVGYLYQAYLMIQLKKYSSKSSQRLRNSKCYPVDVALMDSRNDAFAKENVGWRMETVVFLELCRRYMSNHDVYYFKESSYEVDFVVCRRSNVEELVQVSYNIDAEKTFKRETMSLLKASKATNCDKLTLITAYDERTAELEGRKISIVPCYRWLLGLSER